MKMVALLAEGVDRNHSKAHKRQTGCWSPSSRRAWIEMRCSVQPERWRSVALLAEGVDRNCLFGVYRAELARSPSSRRAWIEICCLCAQPLDLVSRPPRGGRG